MTYTNTILVMRVTFTSFWEEHVTDYWRGDLVKYAGEHVFDWIGHDDE